MRSNPCSQQVCLLPCHLCMAKGTILESGIRSQLHHYCLHQQVERGVPIGPNLAGSQTGSSVVWSQAENQLIVGVRTNIQLIFWPQPWTALVMVQVPSVVQGQRCQSANCCPWLGQPYIQSLGRLKCLQRAIQKAHQHLEVTNRKH